jgi:hypothetical protein
MKEIHIIRIGCDRGRAEAGRKAIEDRNIRRTSLILESIKERLLRGGVNTVGHKKPHILGVSQGRRHDDKGGRSERRLYIQLQPGSF